MDSTSYICCACNRVPNAADWGKNGLVCFGACNAIAIYDPAYGDTGSIRQTLSRHNDRVNVARWIRKNDRTAAETELLSASTDGSAIVWSADGKNYEATSILVDGNTLTIADAVYLRGFGQTVNGAEKLLICTASTEGNVTLWHRSSKLIVEKIQNLTFGRKIPTEGRLSFLPNSDIPIVALALDDCSIHIYFQDTTWSDGRMTFVQGQVLYNHEDWIRCMDFTHDELDNCYLATGSQDSSIRLWKIYLDREESRADKMDETQRRIKRFSHGDSKYAITLESILCGHEHWVYGLHWHPPVFSKNGKQYGPSALLSCAMDKSMIIWESRSDEGGIWREAVRVGEVGGNSLGFYGCKYSPDGLGIMAHGYQGSFHLWKYDELEKHWIPRTGPTGHFSGLVDLCWDPKGRYLMTASTDQTTRIHAPWKGVNGEEIWHEIGRPQVHGYDMSCIAMLGPYRFASGAEEKVVRVFTAPMTFKKYLSTLASTDDWVREGQLTDGGGGASVPALGLTNKAICLDEDSSGDDLNYDRPPTEEELIRHTLWPELQKLYGHGYEIFSIASKSDGSRFATACKSAIADHSAIIIWSTKTWSQVQKISSHRLTVTQMAFSPDDSHLISVSRDRRWTLYRSNDNYDYDILATSSKTNAFHSRIIWCCSWTPDSKYFATGSRDGKIGVWSIDEKIIETGLPVASTSIPDTSINALAFESLQSCKDSYILAVGFESGCIEVQKLIFHKDTAAEWRIYAKYDSSMAHHYTVRRLAFRPNDKSNVKIAQLASCGMDNTVKIHNLRIADLEAL